MRLAINTKTYSDSHSKNFQREIPFSESRQTKISLNKILIVLESKHEEKKIEVLAVNINLLISPCRVCNSLENNPKSVS